MPKTILVVEDNKEIKDSIIELLEYGGYVARGAGNGKEALEFLRSEEPSPDLILLDLRMPVMDGFQFRKEQLSDPLLAPIKLVVISAELLQPEKLADLEVTDFYVKPLDLDSFLRFVSSSLQ